MRYDCGTKPYAPGIYKWLFAFHVDRSYEMNLRDIPRALLHSRGRLVGIALVATGIVLLILAWNSQSSIDEIGATDDPLLQQRISVFEGERDIYFLTGVGALFLGLFAIALLGEPTLPSSVSQSQMISSARMANEIFRGVSLAGNASYLPAGHGLTKERVFVSASKTATIPPSALSDDMILSPGKDGSTPGILVEPLGLRLLDSIEEELGIPVRGVGIEGAEGALQYMKHGLGMMKDFHFKERGGKTILRVEYAGLRDACKTVRTDIPDTCRQAACTGCACLLTAAARATGKMVVVEEVDNKQDTVQFTLRIEEW